MEFLLGAVIVVLTAIARWLYKKFDPQMGRAVILLLAFALSGVVAGVRMFFGDAAFWDSLGALFVSQMAIYEIGWKALIKPIVESLANEDGDGY